MQQINIRTVVRLIKEDIEKYAYGSELSRLAPPTEEERLFANELVAIIISKYESPYNVHSTLTIGNNESDTDEEDSDQEMPTQTTATSQSASSSESEYQPSPQKQLAIKVNEEQMRRLVAFAFPSSGKDKTLKQIQHSFTWVRNMQQVNRISDQVAVGGMREHILADLKKEVFERLREADDDGNEIHDMDIEFWALEAAAKRDYPFKASNKWIQEFKKDFNIVSRKITAFVSRVSNQNEEMFQVQANQFTQRVKELVSNGTYNEMSVWNADQSGIRYELTGGRTLTFKGSRHVKRQVFSTNATKHSFTIMPLVNMNGFVYEKLFVTLQEPTGDFGPRVSQRMIKPPNLVITASKSGIMDRKCLQVFIIECLSDALPDNQRNLLLVDHWTPFRNHDYFKQNMPASKLLDIENIPKGCTSICQPLDCYGFRPIKDYIRLFTRYMRALHRDVNMGERNNIIKLMSIVHNQLSAQRFRDMWRYSFVKAGLSEVLGTQYEVPASYAFRFGIENCHCLGLARIRCCRCENFFCLKHFFIECNNNSLGYHYCNSH